MSRTTTGIPNRGYIPGKPVSRWEASDSDNIDIEYKNLDRPGRQSWTSECFTGPKGLVLKILIVIIIFCLGLIFGYVIRKSTCIDDGMKVVSVETDDKFVPIQQNYDDKVRQQLQNRITHLENFEDSIHTISQQVLLSGVGRTSTILSYIRNMWATFNLDSVIIRNYTVQLMYPNYTMEGVNKVSIVSENDTIFQTHTNETNIHPNYLPFNAYSHTGHVKGSLVYGHYGGKEDFEKLKNLGVNVNQTIVLIRYGKIHPSNKVQHAEQLGVAGVILYPDPQDYTNFSHNNSENNNVTGSWWLPGDAVIRSSVRYWLTGDPITPDYPAVDGIPRLKADSSYPSIPVFPVSYNDARELMLHIYGLEVPPEWVGGLGIPYKTGPGYGGQREDYEVDLNVKNEFEFREIHNCIATMHGQYEKDQYVIVGAHIDSWTMGAIDSGTGYAVLEDLIRTFSDQRRTGWRPRRTIIFAGWDASKYGHIGAYEWAQEYEEQLSSGAVAYINLDAAIRGNWTFYAESDPVLYDVIYSATKSVIFPEEKNRTVYDVWRERSQNKTFSEDQPWIRNLPGDSDHSPFIYRLGISSMSTAFTYDTGTYPNLPTYPVYGTLNDTEDYLRAYIDPNLQIHASLVQVLCDIVLRLADSALLPFNLDGYHLILNQGIQNLQPYLSTLAKAELKIDMLVSAKENFTAAANIFMQQYNSVNDRKSNISEFEVQFLNDKLIRVSRALVHPGVVVSQPQYRNVLIAPHPENLNQEVIFPGIMMAVLQADDSEEWKQKLLKQYAVLVVCLQRATIILSDTYPRDAL